MTGTTDAIIEAAFAAGRADLAAELLRLDALPVPVGADANALHASAWGHSTAGRNAEAERDLRLALRLAPMTPQLHEHLGIVFASQKRFAEANATFRVAERLAPGDPSPSRNRARCLIDAKCYADAEGVLSRLVESGHATCETWDRLGVVRGLLGDFNGAAACFRSQIALQPGEAGAWSNLGNALRDLGRVGEAIEALRIAVRLDPNLPDAAGNLALALATAGDLDAALPWYDRAVTRNPRNAEVRFNRAVALLATGDFARGLPEYEWRFGTGQMRGHKSLPGTPWRGESLTGKSIAVQCEQGLGDALQFSRLATRLSERGAAVTLLAPPTLLRLLRTMPGVDRVVSLGDAVPASDFVAPLMSLPLLTGLRSASIPGDVPSVTAPAEAVAVWRAKLADLDGLKVGIAWQGNPSHVGDRFRSVPLGRFAPLAEVPGVSLISLQLGPGREQLAAAGLKVYDVFDAEPVDFADTAGLIVNLDLVVSVDSAVAHLAGCLARPVWVLLPVNADWRWLRGRDDSPWYPSARLFRQATFGDWGRVIERAASRLRQDARATSPPGPLSEAERG